MKDELFGMARTAADAVSNVPLEDRGREVAMGADGTPTSLVDKAAEDAILEYLDEKNIKISVLREAGGEVYDMVGNVLDMPLSLGFRTNVIAVGPNEVLEMML